MGFTNSQYLEMLTRLNRNSGRNGPADGEPVELESTLVRDILKHCDAQWPRWKVIKARTDKRSTIGVGVHDLTIFMPGTKVLCIEAKTRTGKRTQEQLNWAAEMKMLGWIVHEVRSMEEFLKLI